MVRDGDRGKVFKVCVVLIGGTFRDKQKERNLY